MAAAFGSVSAARNQNFEKFWRCGVVMLSVTEKLLQILLQKPVEIADPVQSLRMHDHAESRIGQERAASGGRFLIVAVNRDDGFEIAEGLSLQTIKSFGDEIGALIDWQSHSDARCRQIASPSVQLAAGTNPLGADFREVRRHGELSGVDGVEAAFGRDTDLESTMQFACGIVNIRFAPRHDRATFDAGLRKASQHLDREAKARSRKERGMFP